MKILIDENLDQRLAARFSLNEASHVHDLGWQGTRNGALMRKAIEAGFEAFITADKNLRFQQNVPATSLAIFVLDIHPNKLLQQSACVAEVESRLSACEPGTVYVIEGPHPKR